MGVSEKTEIDKTPRVETGRRSDRWISAVTLLVIIGAWVLVTSKEWVRPLFLPPPEALWRSLLALGGNLPQDIFDTLITRIIPGFLLGVTVGTLTGILMAMSRVGKAIIDPIVEILRPLPPLALIPLLILWLGIGTPTQVTLIAYGSFIIMVINAYEAVRNVPPIYIHAAATLGANPGQIFRKVTIPAIIPDIFGGIRVSAAASFGYAVAAELMGAQSGLGYRLVLARRYLNTDNILVILAVIALLSFLLDYVIRRSNDAITSWKSRIER